MVMCPFGDDVSIRAHQSAVPEVLELNCAPTFPYFLQQLYTEPDRRDAQEYCRPEEINYHDFKCESRRGYDKESSGNNKSNDSLHFDDFFAQAELTSE